MSRSRNPAQRVFPLREAKALAGDLESRNNIFQFLGAKERFFSPIGRGLARLTLHRAPRERGYQNGNLEPHVRRSLHHA